ncbi:DUF5677 domain-containing protein [Mesorhizobium sp. BR1-1-16]|uniref:DUF5677 domain-containing protein n=1 Tax=Mesorhizobium sp. BR1-1-16 TaxID=2876653 RepID=UPI001CCE0B98|nr:DUF5677 domain-containing protein [Mesorhizobium sp. BR1-1-16]MBZ9939472.1 DUF5677 domain-containing protein [Mesorhizobium sp. BR1-1-16]MBZ9939475.1 DUF5677 domain-containing protein [Mesorhizobium sp. BR1-1-16]
MPAEFDNNGFLAVPHSVFKAPISENYKEMLELARRINRDFHDMLFQSDVRNRDREAIILATLFMRALEHYQAAIIIAENGIASSARVTVRALMEVTFRLRAIATEPEMYQKFIAEDILYRRDFINNILNNDYSMLKKAKENVTNEILDRIDAEIKESKPRKYKIKELSQLAGMHDWYVGVYSLLSKAVHTPVRELEDYLEIREDGEIGELKYAPQLSEIPRLILTAAELISYAAAGFEQRFQTGFASRIEENMALVHAASDLIDGSRA